MKYTGATAAVVLAAVAAWLLRDRLRARHALLFALPALAVAVPWYVKNAVQVGNPVYPVFGAVNDEATRDIDAVLDGYGHGRSLVDGLLLPVRLLGDADEFDRGDLMTPLFLLFAPLTLAVRELRRVVLPVWLGIAAYLGVWFVGSQQARFLVPLMPVLALLAAIAVVAVARAGRLGRLVAVTVVAGALVAGLGISTLYASRFAAVSAGLESDDEFLRRKAPYHEAVEWVNGNLPEDARVLTDVRGALHLERDYVTWTPSSLPTSASAGDFVRRHGITHGVVKVGGGHVPQARAAGGRVIARITAHTVTSRTLDELGPPETFLVFAFR